MSHARNLPTETTNRNATVLLPVNTRGTDQAFIALGFTFGKTVPGDDLFRTATLPDGWTQDDSLGRGSYILDQLGRQRAEIFHKADWWDRKADMGLISLHWYVTKYLFYDGDLVTDPDWATPAAVAERALAIAAGQQRLIEECTAWLADSLPVRVEHAKRNLPEHVDRHAKAVALAERFAPDRQGGA